MSNVTKPRTRKASQGKPKVTTECRKATPEETRAWLGRGWIVPVPRPQMPTLQTLRPEPLDSPIYKGGFRVGATVFGKKPPADTK